MVSRNPPTSDPPSLPSSSDSSSSPSTSAAPAPIHSSSTSTSSSPSPSPPPPPPPPSSSPSSSSLSFSLARDFQKFCQNIQSTTSPSQRKSFVHEFFSTRCIVSLVDFLQSSNSVSTQLCLSQLDLSLSEDFSLTDSTSPQELLVYFRAKTIVTLFLTDLSDDLRLDAFEEANKYLDLLLKNNLLTPKEAAFFLAERGKLLWKLEILTTAFSSFHRALDLALFSKDVPFNLLEIPIQLAEYWEVQEDYKQAAFLYDKAETLFQLVNQSEKAKRMAELACEKYMMTALIYAHAALASHWEVQEETSRSLALRSIYFLSTALLKDPNLIFLPLTREIITKITSVLTKQRNLSEADALLIEVMNSAIQRPHLSAVPKLATTLKQVSDLEYSPNIYFLFLVASNGLPVYSQLFSVPTNPFSSRSSQQADDQEVRLYDEYGTELYAGLFTALENALSNAMGSGKSLETVDGGDMVLIVEQGQYLTCFVIADKDAPLLRQALIKFLFDVEHQWKHLIDPIPYTLPAAEINKLIHSHLKQWINRSANS